jgi:ribose/xylose/arabinose/galactoside ABC-type transport system permease subunit
MPETAVRPGAPVRDAARPGLGRRALGVWRGLARDLALLPVLIVAVIVGSATSPIFLTENNIINVLQQSSELSVVVVGLSVILIAGKFDLSLESTFGLAPMVAAWLITSESIGGSGIGLNAYLAILVVIAIGAIVGTVNALLVVKLGLNAFIVTLAMLILLRGLTLGITSGSTLYNFPAPFTWLGTAEWIGIPVAVIFAGLVFLAAGLFLRYHRIGRAIYAIGGNSEAATAAGIRVDRVLIGVFIVGSILAAIAGLMLTGRIASATANQGQNLIFTAFAAAVIGGISLDGGRGRILGALTGVLLLAVLSNILTLNEVASFWIDACYGAIIVIALIITRFTAGREAEG